ncbi:VOC family protein, partial [Streptomyces sp. SID1034]|uniref:VOC family protein n=1 Tax=Streptomyces sp. SID1034 TaxID=2690248 RepID=UPI00144E0BDB|nr:VOC family protein [Streptomyces sp. SID1034]
PGTAHSADNRSVILEFRVEDVDAVHRKLIDSDLVDACVQAPTTMPWGNRSLLVRDPDGHLVNFFTPVTEDAAARLDR